jgi:hypothetical protein
VELQLSGPELGKIRAAVVKVFGGSADALDQVNSALTDTLDRSVYGYVIVNQKFDLQVGALLRKANGQGWLPSLLGALQQYAPDSDQLKEVIRNALATASASQVLAVAGGALSGVAEGHADLQQILPGGCIVDVPTLHRRLRCVCRVDYADFSPPGVGTGFLVAADIVLTNWHVVRRLLESSDGEKRKIAGELRFRFDLLNRDDAVDGKGRVATAFLGDDTPVLRFRPAGGGELVNGTGEPRLDQLDYALVRLAERVGEDSVQGGGGNATRGHFQLNTSMPEPAAESALMVLQHPMRGELQFAIGKVLGPNGIGSRIKHTAATQCGSSGSPVLNAALAPIALHNGTSRGTELEKKPYNTAVPLDRIVRDLKDAKASEILQG